MRIPDVYQPKYLKFLKLETGSIRDGLFDIRGGGGGAGIFFKSKLQQVFYFF